MAKTVHTPGARGLGIVDAYMLAVQNSTPLHMLTLPVPSLMGRTSETPKG